MRLLDLDPRWLEMDGEKVGFAFQSPTDPKWYQSCFFKPLAMHDQIELLEGVGLQNFQCCNQGCAWQGGPQDFAAITVTPSLDGSPGGLWHGHITNGQIVGGLST